MGLRPGWATPEFPFVQGRAFNFLFFSINVAYEPTTNSIIKSNLLLYSLYHAEACNELAGPISASLRLGNTGSFEEMPQRWQTVNNTVLDLPDQDLYLGPPVPETNVFPLNQLAGLIII